MSIDKQTFVKLEPRRFIPNSEISSLGANQYSTQFVPKEAVAVYRSNGTLTPTSLPFTWDASTGTVTFTSTSAPNNNIFIDYKLYFCTTRYFYIDDNPVDETGGEQEWEPRLNRNEAFSQDVTDMLAGVVGTSSSSFSLLNNDGGLNKYVTKYDNYKNRKTFSYCKLGDDYKVLYNGIITKITVGDKISFLIKAPNKLFDFDASLNNTDRYIVYNRTDFPSLEQGFNGKLIPQSYGALSKLPETKFYFYLGFLKATVVDSKDLFQAAYIGFNGAGHTWLLGVVDDPWSNTTAPPETVPVTYIATEAYYGKTFYKYSISSTYIRYFIQGSRVRCVRPGFSNQSVGIDFIDYSNNYFWVQTRSDVTHLIIDSADLWYYDVDEQDFDPELQRIAGVNPSAGRQLIYTQTDSGQWLVSFFSSYQDDDGRRTFFYNLKSKPISQSNFIKKYILSTGESVNDASFTEAQSQSNSYVMKTINTSENNQKDSVLNAIQDIVALNNGILYFDHANNEYNYKIVNQNLSGYDHQIDDSDILEPNIIPKIDYSDSLTSISMKHSDKKDNIAYIPNSNTSVTNDFTISFNNELRSESYLHNLEEANIVTPQKMTLHSGYNTYYEFSLASDNFFEVNIGEIIRINNLENKILNNETYIDVIVLGLTKSAETVRLKTYDYKKIP